MPAARSTKQPENYFCELLSNEENLQVFKLLGSRCQSIATTVIQLYLTRPPFHSQWHKKDTGVLCFVKDNIRKNFFFRLFCLKRNMLVWEHEMYNNMEYIESTLFLHTFEGEEGIVAFNFANQKEATLLKNIVNHKIMLKKRKEEKKTKVAQSQLSQLPSDSFSNSAYKKNSNPEAKLAKRKRNITKADISIPMDFKHVSHVGFNPNYGFDFSNVDNRLKAIFKKAGVTEKQLQDEETRDFIYDFIDVYRQTQAAEEESQPPLQVTNDPPRSSSHVRTAPPPPPPPPLAAAASINEPYQPRKLVPAPAVPSASSAIKREYNMMEHSLHSPTPMSVPPPPPMETIVSSPPMSGNMPSTPLVDNVGALMESIRNGTTLKPVEERKHAAPEDSRGDLLNEIRKGFKLKPVEEREVKPSSPKPTSGNDIAEALARALAERSKAIHSEEDSDTDTSNDDEWEE